MKRFFLIAGEYSGDAYGAEIIKELKQIYPDAEFRGFGGDKMEEEGCLLLEHCHNMAFMGFVEVVKHLPEIQSWFKIVKQDLKRFQPDAVILIDYPGFNMRVAKIARKLSIPTFGFIAPQVWAWKENRIKKIARDYSHVFGILPFEPEFYSKRGYDRITYVGHPLNEKIQAFLQDFPTKQKPNRIALLPGSRKQELKRILPIMKDLVSMPEYQDYTFEVAGLKRYKELLENGFFGCSNVKFRWNNAYKVLAKSEFAIVTSGTATLETALFKVPQVIVYKTSSTTYKIAKSLSKVKYIGLPNIILNKAAVPELIQEECTAFNLHQTIQNIRSNPSQLLDDYNQLSELLSQHDIFPKIAEEISNQLTIAED